MRGIANEGEALCGEVVRDGEVQRVGKSRARKLDIPQEIAKRGAQSVQILRVREGMNEFGVFFCFAPNNRAAIACQRQDRQRP